MQKHSSCLFEMVSDTLFMHDVRKWRYYFKK